MNPEQFKDAPAMEEEKKEQKEEGGIGQEIDKAPIEDVIDGILDLPAKDLQLVYEAIGKVIKGKKKEAAPKAETAPEDQFNAQDMARSFM